MSNWKEVLSFDKQDLYSKFPNLQPREGDEEICRTVLNNGFFTIAHNISSTSRGNWIRFFKSIGASNNFIWALDSMFDNKATYENPGSNSFEEGDDFKESAWEDMSIDADNLTNLARKEGLYKKMREIAHW